MQSDEISSQQSQTSAALTDSDPPDNPAGIRPIEAALWEIAFQLAILNERAMREDRRG